MPDHSTVWPVSNRGLVAGLAVLGLAVWFGAGVVALVAGLFVALALVARGWSRVALGGLSCQLAFRSDRAFPDDEVELHLVVENRRLVPVPWLEVELALPRKLYPIGESGRPAAESEGRAINLLATLLPFRRLDRRVLLRCRTRGLYDIPHVGLLVGDPLRLFPRRTSAPVDARLVVYPRIVPLEQLGLPSRLAQGDLAMHSMVIDDPLRPIGVRDYRPGDAPRMVNWKASARRPNLQVKVLERTAQIQLSIYLGVDGFDHPWLVYRDALFERAVAAAASLANASIERGGRVGLALSGAEPTYVPAGTGADHLKALLEVLAVVGPRRGRPLESVLEASTWRQPPGATVVAIVAGLTDELSHQLREARRTHPVVILHAGLDQLVPPDGIDAFEIERTCEWAGSRQ